MPPCNNKPYGQQDRTCYKCGIWGKRKAKAPIEAHLVAIDSAKRADVMVPSSTSTPLNILTAAAVITHEENVTQE
ncbi:hypothetical protein E2562_000037 [Oryza meyeriana var. granulata]|uniref:Uncharacterized protein n=1 Tax=Oryza meyeriana var. granulata TaxID=110450 RepID=A0A6G1DBB1_9ORYZ|nr:hypothetical protein E2562_000037 [Oryza meyeriana var. granulata]